MSLCFIINSVCAVLTETPKPVLTVQPELLHIFRGANVTLTCDIQGEGWTHRWQCGDTEYTTTEKEIKITAEHKQICRCHAAEDQTALNGVIQ